MSIRAVERRDLDVADLGWLAETRAFSPPVQPDVPIWMRETHVAGGFGNETGEKHPCCELILNVRGEGTVLIEGQQARFAPGDLVLFGPGVPHCTQIDGFPHHQLAILFLPGMLFDFGPPKNGATLLRRFTARQAIDRRLVRLPEDVRRGIERVFWHMWSDFQKKPLGWEMRLGAGLVELLVTIVRYEHERGEGVVNDHLDEDWARLEQALAFIRRHFAEPIYASDLARATAMSETRLKMLFERTLGMPWTTFLQGYRVRRAATLLCLPGHTVTEAGLSSGFESLSHFIRVFRRFTGAAPSTFARQQLSIPNRVAF